MNKKIAIQTSPFGPFLETNDINANILVRTGIDNFFQLETASEILEEWITRYIEVSPRELYMSVGLAPEYESIGKRILEPLKLSKKYYCLGEYLTSIAMSGLAMEMMTILTWEISDKTFQGKIFSSAKQKKLFGKKFNDLSQYRKIEILEILNIITDDSAEIMHSVRDIRNKYTHKWVISSETEKEEAKKCFIDSMKIFKGLTKIGLAEKDGVRKVTMEPALLKFLKDLA